MILVTIKFDFMWRMIYDPKFISHSLHYESLKISKLMTRSQVNDTTGYCAEVENKDLGTKRICIAM